MSDVWRMSAEDAEEYTRALGQVASGGWRMIALAQKLGVPAALGMTTDAWVRERIGGSVRLGLDERREAVQELTDPEGEFQLTQRQAAEVLGISKGTVHRDLQGGPNGPPMGQGLEEDDPPAGPNGPGVQAAPTVGDVRDEISAGFDDGAVQAEMALARHIDEMARVRTTWIRFVGERPPGVFAQGLDRAELDRLVRDLDRVLGWTQQARDVAIRARRLRKVV